VSIQSTGSVIAVVSLADVTHAHPGGGDPETAAPNAGGARPGRSDHPTGNAYQLVNLMENADLAVFSHCGRWSMIERSADFNHLVRDFLLSN
jgi:hypothetical protein